MPMATMSENWHRNILKQILLWLGWITVTVNVVLLYYSVDFNATKVFVVGFVTVVSNIWIPWEIHARIQPMEEGTEEGKKMANDTMETALKIVNSIECGEITYERAIDNLQKSRKIDQISNVQYRIIVGFINKKLNI